MYRILALLLVVMLAGCVTSSEKAPAEVKEGSYKLLVVSSSLDAVEVYGYPEKKMLTTIPVGKNPRDILVSEDKRIAFVNSLDEGTVTVIDLQSLKVSATIAVGEKPWDMKISPDGTHLYVSDYGGASVAVVDLGTMRVTSKIPVGTAPAAMSFADEGRRIFVANSGSNDVTVIDVATRRVVATVPVGPGPEHVIDNGDYVFVNNQGDNTISVIHINILDKPVDTFKADDIADCGPVVSSRDFTYTTLPDENLVLKLWVEDMSLEAKIPVGDRPYLFSFSPDYQVGFVTNSGSDDVSVLDLVASKVIERIPVGKKPMGIAVI